MFRISGTDLTIADVDTVEQIKPALRAAEPGGYFVYEIVVAHPDSTPLTRQWGVAIKHSDGSVVIEPHQRRL
jgi:hypothetical protein